jgi:hypothetical protein
MSMPRQQTVLLDPAGREQATVLEVMEGVCRVYCPCEETEGMTLAFLQSGDRLRTDRLCSDGACVEALTALKFPARCRECRRAGHGCRQRMDVAAVACSPPRPG